MYLLVFIAGTFFGSFLNLVSDRVINGEPIISGRSHCDFCKKPLKPKNLIPLLSFILQGGKCSYCGGKLSFHYFLSEILAGLLFVVAAVISGVFKTGQFINIVVFIYYLVTLSLFLVLFLTDLKYMLLPESVMYLAIFLAALFLVSITTYELAVMRKGLNAYPMGKYLIEAGYFKNQIKYALQGLGKTLVSALVIAGFFLFLVVITKEKGMGRGDIKLGLLIGLFNGFPLNILAVFIGFLSGAIYSLILVALSKKSVKDVVPFGPFLIFGSIVSLVWGSEILNWYFSLLG